MTDNGCYVVYALDALAELGVEHFEMPVTPEREWQAIRTAAGPSPS